MLKFKKVVSLAIAGMVAISMSTMASAEEMTEFIKESELVFSDDYVPQSLVNYGFEFEEDTESKTRSFQSENKLYDIVDIVVSKENIIIESNGGSEFIDVFGKLKDGTYVNITNDVSCEFKDKSIATWINGRILADKKGNTKIILTYNGVSKKIKLTVKKQLDLDKLIIDSINSNSVKPMVCNTELLTLSRSWRDNAVSMASSIVNMRWTPKKNLCGWASLDYFKAGTTYTGMPYTQNGALHNQQTTPAEYNAAMANKSDFYIPHWNTSYSLYEPQYGCDCSGLVSLSWYLPEHQGTQYLRECIRVGTYPKVGSYNYYNLTSNDLHSAYEYLSYGDAVVNSGHTFLIACNYPDRHYLYVYEQTGKMARYTAWSYDQMANGLYMPFTRY